EEWRWGRAVEAGCSRPDGQRGGAWAASFLTGEPFPRRLAGDAQRRSDPGPGDLALPQFLDPGAQIGLDLSSYCRDTGNVIEHLLVGQRSPRRQPGFGRLVPVLFDDGPGQADALIANVHARAS